MTLFRLMLRLAVVLLLLGEAHAAWAAVCAVGSQDSTCLTPIMSAPQPQPVCSNGAGWTTVTPSVWIGSKWESPQCSYTEPPTCPAGTTQSSPPTWNGTAWDGPNCAPLPARPPSTPSDPTLTCTATMPSGYSGNYNWATGTADISQAASIYAQVNNISGYSTAYESQYFYGPAYATTCSTSTRYQALCYLNADNSLNTLLLLPINASSTANCGGGPSH
jgi:hypothetical protein